MWTDQWRSTRFPSHLQDDGGHGVGDAERVHHVHDEDNTTTNDDYNNKTYFGYNNNVNWPVTQHTAPCTPMTMEAMV